jgi:ribosomal protein S9
VKREEIRVRVRSGGGGLNGQKKARMVYVRRDFLWIGASEHEGLAWVSGDRALRDIRDAIDAMLRSPRAKETK